MTTAIVFSDAASAAAYAAKVDAASGYPAPGVDVGGGVHAPPAQSVTKTAQVLLEKPSQDAWAYPVDPKAPIDAKEPLPVALDATWANATPVDPTAVATPVTAVPDQQAAVKP